MRIADSTLLSGVGYAGCQIVDSTVELCDVRVEGGSGAPANAPFYLTNSDLRLMGNSFVRVWHYSGQPVGPVVAGTGTLRFDPRVTFAAWPWYFAPGISVTSRYMPAVSVEPVGPFGFVARRGGCPGGEGVHGCRSGRCG